MFWITKRLYTQSLHMMNVYFLPLYILFRYHCNTRYHSTSYHSSGIETDNKNWLKILSRGGPKYRASNTMNYNKWKTFIDSSIDDCIENIKTKYKLRGNDLNDRKDVIE